MTIYHVEFAKIGHSLTGGEVCMVELIKYFSSLGYKNVLLTNDNAQETYSREIPDDALLEYRVISSYDHERRLGVLLSYVVRTFQAVRRVRAIELAAGDVLICHSDFFPNTIPAWIINSRNPKAKSINFFHMKAPGIFRGYEGEFTGKFMLPELTIIHYRLNQWLYRLLMKPRTIIPTVNAYYETYLHKQFPRNRIKVLRHFGGVTPGSIPTVEKRYDVAWIGRFHPQKGIDDLAHVIQEVLTMKPTAQFLIIGDGPRKIRQAFVAELDTLGVLRHVHLAGFVSGAEKFKLLAQARVFAMTSYYESFGIVMLEAMASGIPVVAYDLPVYDVFKNGIIKVPLLDRTAMAAEIVKLLDNDLSYRRVRERALEVSAEHSWAMTGQEILEALHV